MSDQTIIGESCQQRIKRLIELYKSLLPGGIRAVLILRHERLLSRRQNSWRWMEGGSAVNVDKVLLEFREGLQRDEKELREIERKQKEKHQDLMHAILGLTDKIREESEHHSHEAFLEHEAWKDELILILEVLRKDHQI
ncbi:hypothetical protein L873DRAFT_1791540 [Choiromyces venosus 120613-1]|uniref:Uncharacterized protein n=1 Tax=Choiromyces venosus 120613-1 TaxID=1336337 RepID=A0A3N4JE57_9PEZI|nr:hypothetical protein L873DRAFT_1791540 [Choiromyces venosus 120613-1]